MINDTIAKILEATPEEQEALAAALEKAKQKKKPEIKSMGQPFDRRPKDEHGRLLTPEEVWDREHPLIRKPYGYCETCQDITGKKTRRVWTRAEVDAFNRPFEEAWLTEKRKLFPNAVLPPVHNMNNGVSRFDDPRYTHPGI